MNTWPVTFNGEAYTEIWALLGGSRVLLFAGEIPKRIIVYWDKQGLTSFESFQLLYFLREGSVGAYLLRC